MKVKSVCILLVALLALSLAGCGKGKVNAAALQAPLKAVTERHDAYVKADAKLSDVERSTALRSSELLNKAMEEALGQKPEAPKEEPKPAAEPQSSTKPQLTTEEVAAITYGPDPRK